MDERPAASADTHSEEVAWQHRLLPMMSRMLIGLTAFFLIASLIQLKVLHDRIQQAPQLDPASLRIDAPKGADAIAVGRMTIEARL